MCIYPSYEVAEPVSYSMRRHTFSFQAEGWKASGDRTILTATLDVPPEVRPVVTVSVNGVRIHQLQAFASTKGIRAIIPDKAVRGDTKNCVAFAVDMDVDLSISTVLILYDVPESLGANP